MQSHNSITWFFTDERGHPRFPNHNRTAIWASTKLRLKNKICNRFIEANCAIYKGERLEDFFLKPKKNRTPEEVRAEHIRYCNRRVGGRWDIPMIEIDDLIEEREWEKKVGLNE